MINEAQNQMLDASMSVLYQVRDLLWQIAEEDGDLGRNAERWNQGGEGYALLEQITAALPPLEAMRDACAPESGRSHDE